MLSQKQKQKLIRDLDSMSSTRAPKTLRKKAQKLPMVVTVKTSPKRRVRAKNPFGDGKSDQSMRGISNVHGQRLDIPLKQPFYGSESLGRFNGSVAFTEIQLPINPGQAGVFPWLSQEAKLWEKYQFDKLEFEFRTTINEFSANALGRVILGVDFDASDPAPSTRSQAEISRPVTAQAPYFNQRLVLRKEDMDDVCGYHFVRPGSLPGQSDIKFYDVGVLNFGTDGNVNANEVGELWVHYAGTFKNQVLESTTAGPTNFSQSSFRDAAPVALTSTLTKISPLATADINGLGIVNAAGVFTVPPGNYLVSYMNQSTAATNMTAYQMAASGSLVNPAPSTQPTRTYAAGAVVTVDSGCSTFWYSPTLHGTLTFVVAVTGSGALGAQGNVVFTSI